MCDENEVIELKILVKDLALLCDQLMPGIKFISVPDYAFLNETLIKAEKVSRELDPAIYKGN